MHVSEGVLATATSRVAVTPTASKGNGEFAALLDGQVAKAEANASSADPLDWANLKPAGLFAPPAPGSDVGNSVGADLPQDSGGEGSATIHGPSVKEPIAYAPIGGGPGNGPAVESPIGKSAPPKPPAATMPAVTTPVARVPNGSQMPVTAAPAGPAPGNGTGPKVTVPVGLQPPAASPVGNGIDAVAAFTAAARAWTLGGPRVEFSVSMLDALQGVDQRA